MGSQCIDLVVKVFYVSLPCMPAGSSCSALRLATYHVLHSVPNPNDFDPVLKPCQGTYKADVYKL